MTLILTIPTKEGVVLAADGQVTSGSVRFAGQKLYRLNSHCAWAAAGEVALFQRVNELIQVCGVDQPLLNLRDSLAGAIKQSVNNLLQTDFRTQFFQGNPQALLSLHPGDFVFAECRSEPSVLHITSYGTPEWIDRPFATGSGEPFAYALLQKYQRTDFDFHNASLLAVKVIEEAIEVNAYGLGPPIHVWHLTSGGIQILDESHMARLSDDAKLIRAFEVDILVQRPDQQKVQTEATSTPNESADPAHDSAGPALESAGNT